MSMYEHGCKVSRNGRIFGEDRVAGEFVTPDEIGDTDPSILDALVSEKFIVPAYPEDQHEGLAEEMAELRSTVQDQGMKLDELLRRSQRRKPGPKKGAKRAKKKAMVPNLMEAEDGRTT